jgi:hypothetical protein
MYINSYNQRTEFWWLLVHKVEERPTLTEVTVTSVFNKIFFKFCRKVLSSVHNVIRLNPLNAELNLICHLHALLGAHHILHVSRIRVNVVFCEALKTEASFFITT